MIELISGAIAYKADNWSGTGIKWLGYSGLALAILFPVLPFMAELEAYGLLLIPYAILCALALRKWGPWGELFVDTDNDPMDEKHEWFYRIIDKIYGMPYNKTKGEKRKQWKVLGWAVRYSIYCLPIALLYSVATLSITPFLLLPIAGLVRGCVYWYGQVHKDLDWCEKWGGALSMMVLVSGGY